MSVIKLNPDETAYFCEQLAIMLNAGMQLGDGVGILGEDIDSGRIKKICGELSSCLNNGESLPDAMEKCGAFPVYAVKMVRIGAMTGRLEDVLRGLTEYYENRAELNRTVRTAVLHPLLLLAMMTAVIIVLIVMVIPTFGDIFSQFDSSVSDAVGSTVDMAYTIGLVVLIVLVVVIIVSALVALLSGIPAVKRGLSQFAAVFPLTKGLAKKFSLAKLSGAMSMMVSAGISPNEVLENAEELISDKKLLNKLEGCRKRIIEGESFADVISDAKIFPAMYARSLKIAYSSGSFEAAWKKLDERCGEAATSAAAGIIAFIEPAIVILLTAVIGAILLSVMIPLMNIMSVLG